MRGLGSLLIALGLACASGTDRERPEAAPEAPTPSSPSTETPNATIEADPSEAIPEIDQASPVETDPSPRAVFATATGDVTVTLEVARTYTQRIRGTQHRESFAPGTGMAYVFYSDARHPFWMKDTYVALDIIHLDSAGTVVGIISEAEPLSVTRQRIETPSRIVIEVPGGYARTNGIVEGTAVKLLNVLD